MTQLAILRRPCARFAEGLTSSDLGPPYLNKALKQHDAYARALHSSGIETLVLEPDDRYPDSCFVEDCAIVAGSTLIWTRPGAVSRQGEVELLRSQLTLDFDSAAIDAGHVDGGDVCQIEHRFLIGLSDRTDEEGARQLAEILESLGFEAVTVDVCGMPGLLHLKSGLSYLGEGFVLADRALNGHPALQGLDVHLPIKGEEYAANAVSIGDGKVLMAAGFPSLAGKVAELGFDVVALEMSEFQKMDGGLSCLSLRFE